MSIHIGCPTLVSIFSFSIPLFLSRPSFLFVFFKWSCKTPISDNHPRCLFCADLDRQMTPKTCFDQPGETGSALFGHPFWLSYFNVILLSFYFFILFINYYIGISSLHDIQFGQPCSMLIFNIFSPSFLNLERKYKLKIKLK